MKKMVQWFCLVWLFACWDINAADVSVPQLPVVSHPADTDHALLIASGKEKSSTCSSCHGADGNKTPNPAWPKLAGQSVEYLSKELMDYKLGEKGGRNNAIMSGIVANLTKEDILALATYYQSLPHTIGAVDPKLAALGARLYRAGDIQKRIPACSACHSPKGLGNAPAAFPLVSGQNAAYLADQLKAFRDGTRKNDLNQIMRGISAKMNDQEIHAVASYMSGLY